MFGFKSIIAILILVSAPLFKVRGGASDDVEFFEKKIRPLLVENCYKCHSAQSEKVKGGLLLDTREGVLKGGDTVFDRIDTLDALAALGEATALTALVETVIVCAL